MNTRALIDTAVINSTTTGSKRLADRLFAWWFNRLVYAQIWEDPVADLDALQLEPGANIVTISSGGCNALAYLAAEPAAVHAVDLNGAHLAMLEMKRAALQHLPGYDDVRDFLAAADQPQNAERYRRYIAPHLSAGAREYWDAGAPLRARHTMFTRHAYRHGLLGRFIGLSHLLVRLVGGNLGKLAQARTPDEQKLLFERHVAPVFRHPLVRMLANRPAALYSLGIPPSQFDALKRDADQAGMTLPELFCERMRHLACDFPLQENCFAAQAFARRYDPAQPAQLPMYLQPRHYEALRRNAGRVHAHHMTLTGFLRSQPAGSMDAYLFLDAQDWMDAAQLTELWQEVTRTAAAGARVVFRSGGSESPLERLLPPDLLARWQTDPEANRALYTSDRSAIYGGMHLYTRCAGHAPR
jgi:S-adenosylmethionine-diacylglycerol 3-amino-3-carboxypropyl transferase